MKIMENEKEAIIEIPAGMTPIDLGYEEDDGSLGDPDSVKEVKFIFVKQQKNTED